MRKVINLSKMKTKIFFNISLATIILSSCGMQKLTPSGISTVKINTNINPIEINDNNKITVKNLKGESRVFTTQTFNYNSFDDYNFTKNQLSKKRRTLIVSHPYYNPDTIVVRRKLRPVVFSLDVLGAITFYLSPSLIIDLANGNIWKVKKSDKTQNLQFSYNEQYYKTQFEYAKEKQTIESIDNYLISYKESPFINDAKNYKNQLLKIKITNDSITKIKEIAVIENKIKLINLLIFSSLTSVKNKSTINNINSLADALLISNKNNSSFNSYLNCEHKFENEEYKVLYELYNGKDYSKFKAGYDKTPYFEFKRVKEVIEEISKQFYEIVEICSNNQQHNLQNYINKINDNKFAHLLILNEIFNYLGFESFDFNKFKHYGTSKLENYFPNISRKEYLNKLKRNKNISFILDAEFKKSWKDYYLTIYEDFMNIKAQSYTNFFDYSNGNFSKANSFSLEDHFLYKTLLNYNIFQNLIVKNEYVLSTIPRYLEDEIHFWEQEKEFLQNNSFSYFNSRQVFNFEKNQINWENIIKNDESLWWKAKNKIFDPIEFGSSSFPMIKTAKELENEYINQENLKGRVFYIDDKKSGFYKSEGCPQNVSCYGIQALKPIQLLNNDLYEINVFRPKYIFKNDTIVLTLKLKDENNSFRYFHKYYIIKGLINNPSYVYPSGKENENANQSVKDIMNAQNKINAVQTELLLNKIDFGDYNAGTPELSKIFIEVDFLFKDYNVLDSPNNSIIRGFDKLNPFDPKLNLLENCNEKTSEYNQFQLLFNYNSDNLFTNSKNKEKNYLGILGDEK